MTTTEICKSVIEEYSGRKVVSIKIKKDPKVSGTVAMRVVFQDSFDHYDFLCCHEVSVGTVEEVEWETWPPNSGNLKFF